MKTLYCLNLVTKMYDNYGLNVMPLLTSFVLVVLLQRVNVGGVCGNVNDYLLLRSVCSRTNW